VRKKLHNAMLSGNGNGFFRSFFQETEAVPVRNPGALDAPRWMVSWSAVQGLSAHGVPLFSFSHLLSRSSLGIDIVWQRASMLDIDYAM
jgi:hypothetical protein